jgi:hypothetical protein
MRTGSTLVPNKVSVSSVPLGQGFGAMRVDPPGAPIETAAIRSGQR